MDNKNSNILLIIVILLIIANIFYGVYWRDKKPVKNIIQNTFSTTEYPKSKQLTENDTNNSENEYYTPSPPSAQQEPSDNLDVIHPILFNYPKSKILNDKFPEQEKELTEKLSLVWKPDPTKKYNSTIIFKIDADGRIRQSIPTYSSDTTGSIDGLLLYTLSRVNQISPIKNISEDDYILLELHFTETGVYPPK